jgi:hypothetical protein
MPFVGPARQFRQRWPFLFMRCPSQHPELGVQCERLANTCWGLDHTAKNAAEERIYWPDPPPMDAIGRYFQEFLAARRRAIRGGELKDREIRKAVNWAMKDEADEPDDGNHE